MIDLAKVYLHIRIHEYKALGSRGEHGGLLWNRDNEVAAVPNELTRRSVFFYCGKLVGHYPVCGWLRVMTTFIKRRPNDVTERWDDTIAGKEIRRSSKKFSKKSGRVIPWEDDGAPAATRPGFGWMPVL